MNPSNTINPNSLFQNQYEFEPHRVGKTEQLVNQIFMHYSRVLVIRVDWYITADYRDIVTVDYMKDRLTQFRNNLRYNTMLYEPFITYIAKLEYGEQRKWHYHLAIFLDGHQVQNDHYWAQQYGDYWNQVLNKGIGEMYSANMNPGRYKSFSLGMIEYNDLVARNNLLNALMYLCKADYPFRQDAAGLHNGSLNRLFSTGQVKPKTENRGRPRGLGNIELTQ